jgi:Tfp pilus assembly protein PilF
LREAIRLKKDFAEAHNNLGNALADKGQLDEAIKEYREAIRLKKDDAMAHSNLGTVLREKGQLDEAITAYREAIRLKKDWAEAHCNLGLVLRDQGRFEDALAALQTGHKLGSQKPGWRHPSAACVRQVKQLIALDARLAKVLKGETAPANVRERLQLAHFCQNYKKLYAKSAAWYSEAFAAEPTAADDLNAVHRYNAACAAALAGCGQGQDAAGLTPMQRLAWRRQALTWLCADLRAWQRLLARGPIKARPVVAHKIQHWLADPDFNAVRAAEALARLPAEERTAWAKLWANVADTRARAQGNLRPGKKPDMK